MVILTSDVVMRRLQDIHAPTQEAIETMSLWIMHYKDKTSIDVIVEGWINSFRIATNDQKRIALFYVMNDVVQKAKNKHVDALIPAFQPAVLTSVGIGRRFEKVKSVMRRCIEIFRQRQVFTGASITAMENLLAADDTFDAEETALDIDSDDIVEKIRSFVNARNVVSEMMKIISEGDFDYREKVWTKMKDREEGAHLLQEVHDAIDTVKQVRHSMENQKKKMIELIETLELARRVFMHQKREVIVVEEAYVNFRDGIKTVHDELVEMEQTGVYPGLTPPREAPSPTAEDDIYATGVETAIKHFRQPQNWDNRQAVDMEFDDDEKPQAPMVPQPSLMSRITQLGLDTMSDGTPEVKKKSDLSTAMDFSKPPPSFNSAIPPPLVSKVNAFGVPGAQSSNIQNILKSLSSGQIDQITSGNGGSSYQKALEALSTKNNGQDEGYHARFESGTEAKPTATTIVQTSFADPRLRIDANSLHEQSSFPAPPGQVNVYQAKFDSSIDPHLHLPQHQVAYQTASDPRLVNQMQVNSTPGYQAHFDGAMSSTSPTTGYQASFVQRDYDARQSRWEAAPSSEDGLRDERYRNSAMPRGSYHDNRERGKFGGYGGRGWRGNHKDRGGFRAGGGYRDRDNYRGRNFGDRGRRY